VGGLEVHARQRARIADRKAGRSLRVPTGRVRGHGYTRANHHHPVRTAHPGGTKLLESRSRTRASEQLAANSPDHDLSGTHPGARMTLRIGIILGSTRPNRNGEQVARWVLNRATERADAEFELVDLRDFPCRTSTSRSRPPSASTKAITQSSGRPRSPRSMASSSSLPSTTTAPQACSRTRSTTSMPNGTTRAVALSRTAWQVRARSRTPPPRRG